VILMGRLEDFETPDRMPVEDEVQIYTWYCLPTLLPSKPASQGPL